MNRRTLLSSTALFPSVGLAGCLDRVASTDSDADSLPDPVSELEFEITDTGFDPRDDPTVSFTEETGEARVKGAIWVGSKKCKEAALTDVSYGEADNSVALRISHGKSDEHPDNRLLGGPCDDAMSADSYEIHISVKEVIRTITVIERDAEGSRRRVSTGN